MPTAIHRQRLLIGWILSDLIFFTLSYQEENTACRTENIPFDLAGTVMLIAALDLVWSIFWYTRADSMHPLLGKIIYLNYTVPTLIVVAMIISDSESQDCPTAFPTAVFWLVMNGFRSFFEIIRTYREWKARKSEPTTTAYRAVSTASTVGSSAYSSSPSSPFLCPCP